MTPSKRLPTILKRIITAALDQPGPSRELKGALNQYLTATGNALRLKGGG